jgi:hypothetical protein
MSAQLNYLNQQINVIKENLRVIAERISLIENGDRFHYSSNKSLLIPVIEQFNPLNMFLKREEIWNSS